MDSIENAQTLDEERDTRDKDFIQHTAREKGKRGGAEQTQSGYILQTPPALEKKNQSGWAQTISIGEEMGSASVTSTKRSLR